MKVVNRFFNETFHFSATVMKKLFKAVSYVWAFLVEFPVSVLVMFLIMGNQLRFYEQIGDRVTGVQVFVAKRRLARWLVRFRVGIYLPGKIILPVMPAELLPRGSLSAVFAYGLTRCRQWRQWSILFPVAYAVAAILALPYPLWNNYFTVKARESMRR